MKKFATTLVMLVTPFILSAGNEAQAQNRSFHQVDEMALELQEQAADICRELNAYFDGKPNYRHAYSDIYGIYTQARHIHELAHDGASLRHIQHDLEDIDRKFHHFERVAKLLMTPVRRTNRYGHDHHSSFHNRRLARMIRRMGYVLHDLQEEVELLASPRVPRQPVIRPNDRLRTPGRELDPGFNRGNGTQNRGTRGQDAVFNGRRSIENTSPRRLTYPASYRAGSSTPAYSRFDIDS